MNIPGCSTPARIFVGQRKDPFVVNLGRTFDLINLNPLGHLGRQRDDLADKNVTTHRTGSADLVPDQPATTR